jgi:thioesterase domain-containing protein/acyl carrier protein
MVEVLTPIWQRLLQHSSIGVEDNFFDLGGDSAIALQLFNEIAEVCGRELPPVMIYQASTIAALAALLEDPSTPRFPPLVLLKDGAQEPPVFITHGLGGSVIDFYQVVRHMPTPHAIHGMQARGIDGVDAPFDCIEDMAKFYLDAVKELQPHGPYLLIGFSLGGLVTLEMAQRLVASGEKIALLAILDSYPHASFLSPAQRFRLTARQAWRRAAAMITSPTGNGLSRVFRPSRARALTSGASYQLPAEVMLTPAMQHMRESAYLALSRYQPRYYPGKIRFVRAAISTYFPDNPAAVWAHLAKEFVVDTVPGDHLGIMTTHFEELADVLSRYLIEALASQAAEKLPHSADSGKGTTSVVP